VRERLATKSSLITRWMKRPMVNCYYFWKAFFETQKRNQFIIKRMKFRLDYGCVIEAFRLWNFFVDVVVQERYTCSLPNTHNLRAYSCLAASRCLPLLYVCFASVHILDCVETIRSRLDVRIVWYFH
jgi:hypothetical protein